MGGLAAFRKAMPAWTLRKIHKEVFLDGYGLALRHECSYAEEILISFGKTPSSSNPGKMPKFQRRTYGTQSISR
jgi:predicted ATP-dependent Lon-type protease